MGSLFKNRKKKEGITPSKTDRKKEERPGQILEEKTNIRAG